MPPNANHFLANHDILIEFKLISPKKDNIGNSDAMPAAGHLEKLIILHLGS